jgi:pyruvoyl-dependent arginine decarboxylase (PvlArgDC)
MFTEGPFIVHLYFCNEGNDEEHVRSTVKIMYKKRFQFERKKRTKETVKKRREAEKITKD